jgi:hypothetical protein
MNPRSPRNPLITATLALGALWAALGAARFAGGHDIDTELIETSLEHAYVGAFALALLLTVPAMLGLVAHAGSRAGVWIAAPGLAAVAVAATASNALGRAPAWFDAVAAPGCLLWLAGSAALAVSLHRAGRVPRSVAVVLPLVPVLALPLSIVGGQVAAGGYWLAVGWLDRGSALVREAPA